MESADLNYVFTWKLQDDGTRIMKCRLTVHGFKDLERGHLDKFSGTASSWGQRAVVATAVQSEWPIVSLDISIAFLKGLTFVEVQQIRGGPKRQVSMVLPRGRGGIEPAGSAVLRAIKGFEDFNDATECLEMLKGGFGLIDAPKLFTMKADKVLKQENIKPTVSDP